MNRDDLTDREQQVAALIATGRTNKQVAVTLHIGARRVRVIVSAIAYKIGADQSRDERLQVALWWLAQCPSPERSTA